MSDSRSPEPDSSSDSNGPSAPPPPTPGEATAPYGSGAPPAAVTVEADAGRLPRSSGLGIASLIVGGVALLLAFVPFINFVSGLIALVGVVLGIVALIQKGRRKGLPIAGLIVSVVALILSIALAIIYTAGFAAAVDETINGDSSVVDPPAAPSDEAVPDDSLSDEEAVTDVGSRENPAPLGSTAEFTELGVREWVITPGASTLNANDLVAGENQFNEPAPAGTQFALLPLAVTYVGEETGLPALDIQVSFISADGNTYESFDTLVVGPTPLSGVNELFPDASGSGNVVIAVPTEGIEQGTWAISTLFGEPFYFAAQ